MSGTSPQVCRVLLALVVAASLAGCGGNVTRPLLGGDPLSTTVLPLPPPEPDSPAAAVRRLAWAMNHLDAARYVEGMAGDFRFVFAAADSAGNAYRTAGLTREDESVVARRMFETGTFQTPPLTRVVLTLGQPLLAEPDPRPGKTHPWHQEIRTGFTLLAAHALASYRISGTARFFLVRGDSAQIPPELLALGVRPDSTRWWIERWEDDSLEPGSAPSHAAMPARSMTLGLLKRLYLAPGPGDSAPI